MDNTQELFSVDGAVSSTYIILMMMMVMIVMIVMVVLIGLFYLRTLC